MKVKAFITDGMPVFSVGQTQRFIPIRPARRKQAGPKHDGHEEERHEHEQ